MRTARLIPAALVLLTALSAPHSARAQSLEPVLGTVVSSGRGSVTIRADDGRFVVFTMDRDTVRPATLPNGARVRVLPASRTANDEAPAAATIMVVEGAAPAVASADPIPDAVRRLERQIERNARRYRAGVRAGVALDPELVSVGAHATLGPIFTPRLLLRPNVEVAYGELTTLFAVNLEGIYRLTALRTGTAWSPYAGGGVSLGFSHRGFSVEDERSFDFDDLDLNGGLSLLAGVEKPSGVFVELKTTIYALPTFRMLVGFTF